MARVGLYVSERSLSEMCKSLTSRKAQNEPHSCFYSFGCNTADILQEIAYFVQEDSCLKGSLVGSKALSDMEYFVQGNLNTKPQIGNN